MAPFMQLLRPWRERRPSGGRLIVWAGSQQKDVIGSSWRHSMRPPRTTIRRLMAAVLFIAAATWAGVAVERTQSNRARFHTHFHANGVPHDWNGEFSMTPEWVPFWPVYWRTLLSLPW